MTTVVSTSSARVYASVISSPVTCSCSSRAEGLQDLRVYCYWRSPTVLGSTTVRRCVLLCPLPSAHNLFPPSLVMSSVSASPVTTATSSKSRFQEIFQAALKSYQKQTKKDLLTHPLASQLQSCDSTAAILAILHDQVRQFEKNSASDERLTKWLGPTVNVLNAFSATVSGGVSLVSFYLSQCKA